MEYPVDRRNGGERRFRSSSGSPYTLERRRRDRRQAPDKPLQRLAAVYGHKGPPASREDVEREFGRWFLEELLLVQAGAKSPEETAQQMAEEFTVYVQQLVKGLTGKDLL